MQLYGGTVVKPAIIYPAWTPATTKQNGCIFKHPNTSPVKGVPLSPLGWNHSTWISDSGVQFHGILVIQDYRTVIPDTYINKASCSKETQYVDLHFEDPARGCTFPALGLKTWCIPEDSMVQWHGAWSMLP